MNTRLLILTSLTVSTAIWGICETAYGQTSITVPNFSFEINPGNCNQCQGNTTALPDWSITNNPNNSFNNNSGAQPYSSGAFNSIGTGDGSNFAYLNFDPGSPNSGYTATITSAASVTTIQPGTYTLTIAVGKNNRTNTYGSTGNISLSLLDASNNDAVLASTLIPNNTEPFGTFTDYTVTYFSNGSLDGHSLLIQMSSTDPNASDTYQPGFDNVRLDFLAVPEPSTWIGASLVGLMLLVQIARARSFSKRNVKQ
jgi:hypothetical protein